MSAGIFLSTFDKSLDKQGRVCIPVEFRNVLLKYKSDSLQVGFVAFRSYTYQAVECFSFQRMEQLSAQMDTLDPFSQERDNFSASVFADSHLITFDMEEGRVKMPSILLEHAQVTDKIMFVGKGATFQLWSPELFKEHQEKARETLKQQMHNKK